MKKSNEETKISVIIPVYNVEKYLDKCIKSVVNQTYKNLEIILVDDGSPDNCSQMCDEWAKKDERIKVIHKANGGVSSARNVGLDNATGEYIAFVDSDDFLDLDYYEKMLEGVDFSKVDLVVSNTRRIDDETGVGNANNSFNKDYLNTNDIDEFCAFVSEGFLPPIWNKIYKKKLIKQTFRESILIGEDRIFNFNYLQNINNNVVIKNNLFYNYILYKGSCFNRERSKIYEICKPHIEEYKVFLDS